MMKEMKKKNNSNRNNIVEISSAAGFMIGSTIWFCIYFSKDNLHFEKMVIYMFVGLLLGGILGEIYVHFKK